jgi:hypothetical protein
MSRIIKEPFAPRRRHFMMGRAWSGVNFLPWRLKGSLVGIHKLAQASLDDLCMIVLLVSLLVTTLLLPWIVI